MGQTEQGKQGILGRQGETRGQRERRGSWGGEGRQEEISCS